MIPSMADRDSHPCAQPLRAYTPLHLAAQMDRVDVAKLVGGFVCCLRVVSP
jgi:hypothetical protein